MKKFLRIKTWFVRLFSPDKKTLGAIGEDLRKVAVTAIGVGIVGVVSENGIYGHSRFCNTDFDDKLACLNLYTPLEATDGAASRALCRFWTENP
ncbi:hypothetical protein PWE26_16090 (plasmid) [Enterobacter hormaechei subsp. xiangfangensis]|uniref:hypothetical protein n=1 Tax=Enterobacter hormaechei TaxID=158836 RepID=UPI00256A9312|nr:hypothetical protein [Enterobacter hormaechei]MDL4069428.1 hypothetical protein [Enterobacter hormaechei subsp. xiangfangensis]